MSACTQISFVLDVKASSFLVDLEKKLNIWAIGKHNGRGKIGLVGK